MPQPFGVKRQDIEKSPVLAAFSPEASLESASSAGAVLHIEKASPVRCKMAQPSFEVPVPNFLDAAQLAYWLPLLSDQLSRSRKRADLPVSLPGVATRPAIIRSVADNGGCWKAPSLDSRLLGGIACNCYAFVVKN